MTTPRARATRVRLVAGISAVACVFALADSAGAKPTKPGGAAARQRAYIAATSGRGASPADDGGTDAGGPRTSDDHDLAQNLQSYALERSLPSASVSGQALVAARQQAGTLSHTGGGWQEVTGVPYNAEPDGYTDPFWSNAGSGEGIVGGRTTSLVADRRGVWYAGTADGGVWRSTDRGAHWAQTFDDMPSLSIGALAVSPTDGALWVGTGEANTNSDSYQGTGVYRSTDGGRSYQQVGGTALVSHTVYRVSFTKGGAVLAATDDGLWRLSSLRGTWQEVLAPFTGQQSAPYLNQVTDVAVTPGGPQAGRIVAAVGWRSATPDNTTNGFYVSTDDGRSFTKITPTGDINAADIGRTTFGYAADGSKLYAIVQSPAALNANAESVLQGIYRSDSGNPAGPWTRIADESKLAASGSALAVGSGYGVGVQAWYNQALSVDPTNPDKVYASLEEVFESTDAGANWVTASPYWNYGLACGTSCPKTTHADQHALMITGGKVVIGNDGGVYSRPQSDTQQYGDWSDLNATLHTLQYYDAKAGATGKHDLAYWGGLQDNGTSVLTSSRARQMVEPAGGDGFTVLVDPADGTRAVGEYTDLTMYSTTDGGHTFTSDVSPGCVAQETVGLEPRADCDPNARFGAPFISDTSNINTWVAGGQDVWVSKDGWNTHCNPTACSWDKVYDTGDGNVVTALAASHGVIYAAWVSGSGNPSPTFKTGIATNAGGTWHEIDTSALPNRYIAGLTVDPNNPNHAYAIYNGYSRRWIPAGGNGHVFETTNGGKGWTDISGNLPDAPADALVLLRGQLVLGTDIGAFQAAAGKGARTRWQRAGKGLPNSSINNLTVAPDGRTIVAATHGRGIWTLRV